MRRILEPFTPPLAIMLSIGLLLDPAHAQQVNLVLPTVVINSTGNTATVNVTSSTDITSGNAALDISSLNIQVAAPLETYTLLFGPTAPNDNCPVVPDKPYILVLNCILRNSKFESNLITTFLNLHGFPQSDANLIYQYGRSDLRDQLRALMFSYITGIIAKTPSTRDAQEQQVYQWIQQAVRDNEVAMYAAATAEYNKWFVDPCHFSPDPTIAAKFGINYSGAPWCNPQLFEIFATSKKPTAGYFKEYGQTQAYDKLVSSKPGGVRHLYAVENDATAARSYVALGVGLGLAAAGTLGVAAIGDIALLTAELYAAVPLEEVAISLQMSESQLAALQSGASSAAESAVEGVATAGEVGVDAAVETTLALGDILGPAAIILIAIQIAVTAGLALKDDVDNNAAISAIFDYRNNQASKLPDLAVMIQDQVGYQKIFQTFMAATLPDNAPTTPLPSPDPNYRLAVTNEATHATTLADSFQYYDTGLGAVLTVKNFGNWWLITGTDSTGRSISRFANEISYVDPVTNINYHASRYSNNRVVIRKQSSSVVSGEKACPADSTGVTPGAQVKSTCDSYAATSFRLKGPNSSTLTIQLPQTPIFLGPFAWDFDTGATRSFKPELGTIFPISFCTFSNAGVLPQGVTFANAQYSGTPAAGTEGTYVQTLTASCGGLTASKQFTLTVHTALSFVWPPPLPASTTLDVIQGRSYKFTVQASGATSITVDPGALPRGMGFVDNGNGTGTISGTVKGHPLDEGFPDEQNAFVATSGSGNTAKAVIKYNIKPSIVPEFPLTTNITWVMGQNNNYLLNGTVANVPLGFQTYTSLPAFITFKDNGDNTATVAGRPPFGETSVDVGYQVNWYQGVLVRRLLVINFINPAPNLKLRTPLLYQTGMQNCMGGTLDCLPVIDNLTPDGMFEGFPGTWTFATLPPGVNYFNLSNGVGLPGTPPAGSGGMYKIPVTFTSMVGDTAKKDFTAMVTEPPSFADFPDRVILHKGVSENVSLSLKRGFPLLAFSSPGDQLPESLGTTVQIAPGADRTALLNELKTPAAPGGALNLFGAPNTLRSYSLNLSATTKIGPASNPRQVGSTVTKPFTVLVVVAGDVNGDAVANCADVQAVKKAMGAVKGQALYSDLLDADRDGLISNLDLAFVTANLRHGTQCQ